MENGNRLLGSPISSTMIGSFSTILYPILFSVAQGLYTTGAYLLVAVPRIADAIDRTRTEYEETATEQAAFDEFAKRIAALDIEEQTFRAEGDSHQLSTDSGVTTVVNQTKYVTDGSATSTKLSSVSVVQEAYRETVMAVPHYENEYGESLDENLAAELGVGLSQTLSESDVVTPQLKLAILKRTRQASNQRRNLLSFAETEHETLIEARRQIRDLYETATTIEDDLYPRPVRELVQSWDRLETVTTDCQKLLQERQKYLQADVKSGSMTRQSFQEYLYQPFQWDYPVLNDGLDTLTRIQHAKQNTLEAIYNW